MIERRPGRFVGDGQDWSPVVARWMRAILTFGLLLGDAVGPQAAVSKSFYDGVLIAARMAMDENFTVGSVSNG